MVDRNCMSQSALQQGKSKIIKLLSLHFGSDRPIYGVIRAWKFHKKKFDNLEMVENKNL